MESQTSCEKELAAGEIIMNNEVIAAEKCSVSAEKAPKIIVMDPLSLSEYAPDIIPASEDNNGGAEEMRIIEYSTDTPYSPKFYKQYNFMILWHWDYEDPNHELADLQYVVELRSASKTTEARFENHDNIGCDGKRVHGRRPAEILSMEVWSNSNSISDIEDDDFGIIELWGGWATGHSAVTLMHKITFQRKPLEQVVEKASAPSLNDAPSPSKPPILADLKRPSSHGFAESMKSDEL